MANKILGKPHIFYSLSHIKAQFMVSEKKLIDNFFLISLEINDLYLTFKSNTSTVVDVFTVTISIQLTC